MPCRRVIAAPLQLSCCKAFLPSLKRKPSDPDGEPTYLIEDLDLNKLVMRISLKRRDPNKTDFAALGTISQLGGFIVFEKK